MLVLKKGDMFQSEAKILVNAVNCVGVMSGGLAAIFKKRFPDMFVQYAAYCKEKKLTPGGIHVYKDKDKWIFNVATKDHWLQDSQYEWIETGLNNIVIEAKKLGVDSIAVPGLGCGLGNLSWNKVKIMIENVDWTGLTVEAFEPL